MYFTLTQNSNSAICDNMRPYESVEARENAALRKNMFLFFSSFHSTPIVRSYFNLRPAYILSRASFEFSISLVIRG